MTDVEGWPSGRRHPPTKRTWALTAHLGFESLALLQRPLAQRLVQPTHNRLTKVQLFQGLPEF